MKMNDDLKNFWNDEKRLKKAEKEINQNKEVKHEITLNFDVYTNSIKSNKEEKSIQKNFNFTNKNSFEEKVFKVDKKAEVKIKFKEYTKDENKEYKPRHLIIQIILNTILFLLSVYFDTFGFIFIMILNFCLVWFYSLISILKNDFKKESNKTVWLIALIFIPFLTPYIYPDFEDVQTI